MMKLLFYDKIRKEIKETIFLYFTEKFSFR